MDLISHLLYGLSSFIVLFLKLTSRHYNPKTSEKLNPAKAASSIAARSFEGTTFNK
jgi:hypothetical protein